MQFILMQAELSQPRTILLTYKTDSHSHNHTQLYGFVKLIATLIATHNFIDL